jgi:hypothetical protein
MMSLVAGSAVKIGKQTFGNGTYIFKVNADGKSGQFVSSTQSSAIVFSPSNIDLATDTAVNTGQANTDLIVAAHGAEVYAAQYCADATSQNITSWYLPSKDDVANLATFIASGNYRNIIVIDRLWSSSQITSSTAWLYGNGSLFSGTKTISGGAGRNYKALPIADFNFNPMPVIPSSPSHEWTLNNTYLSTLGGGEFDVTQDTSFSNNYPSPDYAYSVLFNGDGTNGNKDYIRVVNAAPFLDIFNSSFSWSILVRVNSLPASKAPILAKKWNPVWDWVSNQHNFELVVNSNSTISVALGVGESSQVSASLPVTVGEWVRVTVSVNRGVSLTLAVGTGISEVNTSFALVKYPDDGSNWAVDWNFGQYNHFSGDDATALRFQGYLSHVYFWTRALTLQEITDFHIF